MAETTAPRPTERAMRCAVEMEIHAACSTMTIAKGHAIDKHFPGYDDTLAALKTFMAIADSEGWGDCKGDHPLREAVRLHGRLAIARAEGRTSDEEAA